MELNPKQKRKLEKLSKVVDEGNLAVVEHIFELEEKLDSDIAEIKKIATENKLPPEIVAKIKTVKGEKGDKGDKGDIGNDGKDGTNGRDGKDGKQGERGESGIDGKNGRDGIDGQDGLSGVDGRDGRDGKDGKDAPILDIKSLKKDIEDAKNMAVANAVPVTTAFYNGLRAKNLTIDGATATQIGDTVHITGITSGVTINTIQVYTPSASGTATLDLSKGNIHHITMPAGNITIAISNGTVGQCFIIRILQDSVGSRTVTWFTTIKWAGGTPPTLTTTASKADTVGFEITGTNTYDGYVVGQNI